MPKPKRKKLHTTTGNGEVQTMGIYPKTNNAFASIKVRLRPNRARRASTMKAAETNPTALVTNIRETIAYPIP